MPIHNPDRQGLIITGSDINSAGYGNNFVFDILSKPGIRYSEYLTGKSSIIGACGIGTNIVYAGRSTRSGRSEAWSLLGMLIFKEFLVISYNHFWLAFKVEVLILVRLKNSNSPFGQSASRMDYVRPRLFYDVNK